MAVNRVAFSDPTFIRVSEGSVRDVALRFLNGETPENPNGYFWRVDNTSTGEQVIPWTGVATSSHTATLSIPQIANKMGSDMVDVEKRELVIAGPDGVILGTLGWEVENRVGFNVGDTFPGLPAGPSGEQIDLGSGLESAMIDIGAGAEAITVEA